MSKTKFDKQILVLFASLFPDKFSDNFGLQSKEESSNIIKIQSVTKTAENIKFTQFDIHRWIYHFDESEPLKKSEHMLSYKTGMPTPSQIFYDHVSRYKEILRIAQVNNLEYIPLFVRMGLVFRSAKNNAVYDTGDFEGWPPWWSAEITEDGKVSFCGDEHVIVNGKLNLPPEICELEKTNICCDIISVADLDNLLKSFDQHVQNFKAKPPQKTEQSEPMSPQSQRYNVEEFSQKSSGYKSWFE